MEINPKNPVNFGGLIEVPSGDSIKEMYISVAPATFITTPAAQPTQAAQTTQTTQATLSKPKTSVKSKITGLGKGPITEFVRTEVRNIINDSF